MVDDDFVGKTVTVPSYVWPNEKVPRGKTGWEGEHQEQTRPGGFWSIPCHNLELFNRNFQTLLDFSQDLSKVGKAKTNTT